MVGALRAHDGQLTPGLGRALFEITPGRRMPLIVLSSNAQRGGRLLLATDDRECEPVVALAADRLDGGGIDSLLGGELLEE
jgi:hypothetical protein